MKKIKLALTSLCILLLPVMTLAADVAAPPSVGSLQSVVASIENALWIVFGLIAVVCFVVAGILFLAAGGIAEKVQVARSAFIWGVAGVVVGIVAYSIVAIVASVIH